jgi:superfamily II DNA helicase RecQ
VDWDDIAIHEAAERRKLREMVNFAYHEKCLRQFILRYFGDRKDAANCRCSNCQPKLKWSDAEPVLRKSGKKPERKPEPEPANVAEDAPQSIGQSIGQSICMIVESGPRALSDDEHLVARKILSCIARMEGKYGKGMVASVLRGVKAKNVIANELDQLTTYGLLGEHSQDDLTRFINALIVAGCVRQTSGAIPTVSLTTLGGAVMRDQTRVELDLEAVEADTSDEEITLPPNYSETHEQTYALYQQGLSIEEIAEKRNLKPTTIETHLAALIEEGREIALSVFLDDQDRALIEAAAAKAGLDGLRPIKDQLPERIAYGPIRFVVADIKRRQKASGG